jgi:hypothetical protein
MEMAQLPKNKQNIQMPISVFPKWLGFSNKIIQIAAGIILSPPLMRQIGKNHGTTKSVSEIQNHHFPFTLNRVSVIAQLASMQPNLLIYAAAGYIEWRFCQVQILHKPLQINKNSV